MITSINNKCLLFFRFGLGCLIIFNTFSVQACAKPVTRLGVNTGLDLRVINLSEIYARKVGLRVQKQVDKKNSDNFLSVDLSLVGSFTCFEQKKHLKSPKLSLVDWTVRELDGLSILSETERASGFISPCSDLGESSLIVLHDESVDEMLLKRKQINKEVRAKKTSRRVSRTSEKS